jgi:hypothetical protein
MEEGLEGKRFTSSNQQETYQNQDCLAQMVEEKDE